MAVSSPTGQERPLRFPLSRQRRKVWLISVIVLLISTLGLVLSWTNPQIRSPLRPGLDFTGGTQIQLERVCGDRCQDIRAIDIQQKLESLALTSEASDQDSDTLPNLAAVRVQLLDRGESVVLRMPALSASQGQAVIEAVEPIAGPFEVGGQSVDTIGPSLGGQLLRSSLISLLVAFAGIAVYISVRYDGRYAVLALVALGHDVLIVCGCFAWLGLMLSLIHI